MQLFSKKLIAVVFYYSSIITLLFVLINSCDSNNLANQLNIKLNELNRIHIPDKSLDVNDIKIEAKDKNVILTGKTTNRELYWELRKFSDSLATVFDVLLLPDPSLGDSTFGIVNVSVTPIRENPLHSSQMIDQAILGNTVTILYQIEDWYLCQTHYSYVGWITKSTIYQCDTNYNSDWITQAKYKIKKLNSTAYSQPNKLSTPLTDLVLNNRIRINSELNNWIEILLPDGRIGFIEKNDIGLSKNNISTKDFKQKILNTAMAMKGVPYLWGGNSSKGNDCSGFTQTVFSAAGFLLPRDARQQAKLGKIIEPIKAELGDLFFFGNGEKVTHVGISLGGLDFIHQGSKLEGRVDIHSLNVNSNVYSPYRKDTFMFAKKIASHYGK